MLQCVVCKVARYCSKNCQRLDWKSTHKKVCKRVMTMDTSAQCIYYNQSFPCKDDKQACWLYQSQSNHTHMFLAATNMYQGLPFRRPDDPGRTTSDYIKDGDWHGWREHEKDPFRAIIKGRLVERDSCVRRKDWRGWLGAAIAEQAMSNCQIALNDLTSAGSLCRKSVRFMDMVLADASYVGNTLAPEDRLDIDGTHLSIQNMRENLECMVFKTANVVLAQSLFETEVGVGHDAGMRCAAATVAVIAKYELESTMWEKARNRVNAYGCEISILKLYCKMARFELEDGSMQAFDVSPHLRQHMDRAATFAPDRRHGEDHESFCLYIIGIIDDLRLQKIPLLEVPVP